MKRLILSLCLLLSVGASAASCKGEYELQVSSKQSWRFMKFAFSLGRILNVKCDAKDTEIQDSKTIISIRTVGSCSDVHSYNQTLDTLVEVLKGL